jgi:hypothetical protein
VFFRQRFLALADIHTDLRRLRGFYAPSKKTARAAQNETRLSRIWAARTGVKKRKRQTKIAIQRDRKKAETTRDRKETVFITILAWLFF